MSLSPEPSGGIYVSEHPRRMRGRGFVDLDHDDRDVSVGRGRVRSTERSRDNAGRSRSRDRKKRDEGQRQDKRGSRRHDRERSGRNSDQKYAREMAQRNQMLMMGGMMQQQMNPGGMANPQMNPAMQWAMMQQMMNPGGMANPQMMLMMQQQQLGMMGKGGAKGARKDGSSSDDDSDDDPLTAAAVAFDGSAPSMWPGFGMGGACPPPPPPPPASLAGHFASTQDVEITGMNGNMAHYGYGHHINSAMPSHNGKGKGSAVDSVAMMGRRPAKATIEKLISDYRLSPGSAWMLRALAPDKAKLAARIDPAGQPDPEGYVVNEIKKIV